MELIIIFMIVLLVIMLVAKNCPKEKAALSRKRGGLFP